MAFRLLLYFLFGEPLSPEGGHQLVLVDFKGKLPQQKRINVINLVSG